MARHPRKSRASRTRREGTRLRDSDGWEPATGQHRGVPGEVVAYRWVARQLPASAHREEAPFDEQCDDWANILIDERQVNVGVVVGAGERSLAE